MRLHRLVKLWRLKLACVAAGDAALAALALALLAPHSWASPVRAGLLAGIWLAALFSLGLYDFPQLRDRRASGRWLGAALAFNAAAGALFFARSGPGGILAAAALAHAGFLGWRLGWLRLLRSRAAACGVAFVGKGPLVRALRKELASGRHPGYRVVDWPWRPPFWSARLERWSPAGLGGLDRPDLLVIDHALLGGRRFTSAFSLAVLAGVPAIEDLELYEALYRKVAPRRAATPDWLLSHVLPRRSLVYPALKRVVDLAGAGAALVALSPVIAASAVLAALDGGKPLYRQSRVGLLGREFTILKFRTMRDGAGAGEAVLSDSPNEDPRITRWGAVLRRYRLDELPQLLNVLSGDMSLVGPRPERPEAIRVLERAVPAYHLRHLVKPGMTGWAQLNFRATNVPDGTLEKLRYDLYYLKHASPALDGAILLRTLKRLLQADASLGYSAADSVNAASPSL